MNFVCPICNASLKTKGALVKHIKNIHPGVEVIIPRKIRGSTIVEPSIVEPSIVQPLASMSHIVNNEIELLRTQHALEIERLDIEHQHKLNLMSCQLELEFVKKQLLDTQHQNDTLKMLLIKALDRHVEVSSNKREPNVEPEPEPEPEPVFSEKKVAELKPVFSEKKVANKKIIPSETLDVEKPNAQNVGEAQDFALAEGYDIFVYDKNNDMFLSTNIYDMPSYTSINNLDSFKEWFSKVIKYFMDLDISPFHYLNKKLYVKNDEGNWVVDNDEFRKFISWMMYKVSRCIVNKFNSSPKRTDVDQVLGVNERVYQIMLQIDDNTPDSKFVTSIYNKIKNT
jgi:hypothetical protein